MKPFKILRGAKAGFFGKFLEVQRLCVLMLLDSVWSDASFSSGFITDNFSLQQINVKLYIFSSGSFSLHPGSFAHLALKLVSLLWLIKTAQEGGGKRFHSKLRSGCSVFLQYQSARVI